MNPMPGDRVRAFTLVEMMVVVAIIGVLLALLFPAVQAARESSRSASCKSNLRQFGIGLSQHAEKFGTYCSGAFDWMNDGSVTEIGWVADLVSIGIPPGSMLCPTNPAQISATYNDLLNVDTSTFDSCVNRLGSMPRTAPDGTQIVNPCRQIAATPLCRRAPWRGLPSCRPGSIRSTTTRTTPPVGGSFAAAWCWTPTGMRC